MCRVVVIAAVFGCLCITSAIGQTLDRRLFQSEAVYELHLANAAYRRCDANRDGAFQPDELACYDALPIKASYLPPPPIKPSTLLTGTAVEAAPKTAAARAKNEATPDLLAASNKAFLIVRRSRDAIGSFADPKPFANAAGQSSLMPTTGSMTTRFGRRAESWPPPSCITGRSCATGPISTR